jgi:hypothetical protein
MLVEGKQRAQGTTGTKTTLLVAPRLTLLRYARPTRNLDSCQMPRPRPQPATNELQQANSEQSSYRAWGKMTSQF